MKQVFYAFLWAAVWGQGLWAQSLVGSSGRHFASGSVQLSWSLGEPVIGTWGAGSTQFTQGFQQPLLLVNSVENIAAQAASIHVFPNPTPDLLTVRIEGGQRYAAELFDVLGRSLYALGIEDQSQLSLSDYPAGNYLLRIQTVDGQLIKTVKIQKNQ